MRSQGIKRNYIIIALCMILVIMGVGYAAFSSMLNITGTANITNSWCIGFDNTKTNAYQSTPGFALGTSPVGTMSYTGAVCGSNIVSHADLSADFYQPGDQIIYTLTIKNKSSITAAIKSIKVDNQNVTSNTTITKGNIIYTVNMPSKTTLTSNEETTMTIVADFQDDESIGTGYTGETQTISVEINGQQDDGNGGFTPTPSTFTGSIYRYNTNYLAIGESIIPGTKNVWCVIDESDNYNSCTDDNWWIETEQDCLDYIYGNETCIQGTAPSGAGNYTTNASTLNKTVYLKHDVENDIVTASYVCLVFNNTEHCMKGGDGGAAFNANKQIANDFLSFYNLSEGHSPGCRFNSNAFTCDGGSFSQFNADSTGGVNAYYASGKGCVVNSLSSCYE